MIGVVWSFFCLKSEPWRSAIQFKFLDGGTSNEVPKADRTFYSSRDDWQENKENEGGEVGIMP